MRLGILLFAVLNACVFLISLRKAQQKHFYSDTPFLFGLGIFVWGDGLVLSPFWIVSSILFWFLSPVFILRYFLLFFLIRGGYEVIYWINHQFSQKNYYPPLFRHISWLSQNDAAILYQLLNTCQVILCAFGLLWSFYGKM